MTSINVIAEYIWLSGADSHHDIRSKCKTVVVPAADWETLKNNLTSFTAKYLHEWNFDGSSTNQALGLDTEILIRPAVTFKHPFIHDVPAVVTLCECFFPNGKPTPSNTRFVAREAFAADKDNLEPWFGMEQEYVLYSASTGRPLDWPEKGYPAPQGPYYCSNGQVAYGRKYAMQHYQICLNMGLKISGTNAEVMPAQWEYQVGPCTAIEAGDHMTMARWVYLRLSEEHNFDVNFDCKPVSGDWNGSGCHTNFSTKETRAPGGLTKILEIIDRLGDCVVNDIPYYGANNDLRLSGKHETSRYDEFSFGVGTRCTSIRIPNQVNNDKRGYLEDRRFASDCDPYVASARLFASAAGLKVNSLEALRPSLLKRWMPTKSTKKGRVEASAEAVHH